MSEAPFPLDRELFRRRKGAFFGERAVSKALAEARPYVPFEQGDGTDVFEAEERLGLEARWPRRALRTVTRQSGGLYMVRHAIPELYTGAFPNYEDGTPIVAEVRPFANVRTESNTARHRHDDGTVLVPEYSLKPETRERHEREARANAASLDKARSVVAEAEAWVGPMNRAQEQLVQDSGEMLALHELGVARLRLPRPVRTPEKAVKALRDQTQAHIAASHGGENVQGWHYVDEEGAKYVHPPGARLASRLEMHPWAHERLLRYHRGRDFFVVLAMEGVPKADAALQYIIDHDLPATVVDIPAVWNWKSDKLPLSELMRFTRMFLDGVHVKVVCDSDWNPDSERRRGTTDPRSVLEPTRQLTEALNAWGAEAVALAPTNHERYCRLHKAGKGSKRGQDDFYADGLGFDDLVPVTEPRRRPVFVSQPQGIMARRLALLEYFRQRGSGFYSYKGLERESGGPHGGGFSRQTFANDVAWLVGEGYITVVRAQNKRGYKGVFVALK